MALCVRRWLGAFMTRTRFSAALAIMCAATSLSALASLTPSCDLNPHPLPPSDGFASGTAGHGGGASGGASTGSSGGGLGGGPLFGGNDGSAMWPPLVPDRDASGNPWDGADGGSGGGEAGGGGVDAREPDGSPDDAPIVAADAQDDGPQGDAHTESAADGTCDTPEAGE